MGKSSSFNRCSLARCISASNKDSFPFTSGIFRYVFINEKGVIRNSLAAVIPSVCESNTLIVIDLINVLLPPALGPVITIFGLGLPKLTLLRTTFSLSRHGCHISFAINLGVLSTTYSAKLYCDPLFTFASLLFNSLIVFTILSISPTFSSMLLNFFEFSSTSLNETRILPLFDIKLGSSLKTGLERMGKGFSIFVSLFSNILSVISINFVAVAIYLAHPDNLT